MKILESLHSGQGVCVGEPCSGIYYLLLLISDALLLIFSLVYLRDTPSSSQFELKEVCALVCVYE